MPKIFGALVIMIAAAQIVAGQDLSTEEIESLTVQKRILDSLLDAKQSEVEQLYLIDEQLGLTTTLLWRLERKKQGAESDLAQLSLSIDSGRGDLEKTRAVLAQNLRNFYMNYQPAPAALFAAGSIHETARQLYYFKSAVRSLRDQIDSIAILQCRLESDQNKLRELNAELGLLVKRTSLEESLLERRKKDKARLLDRLEEDVALRRQYLENLAVDQNQLADLTASLGVSTAAGDFSELRGRLIWPARGRIVRHFGRELDQLTGTETFSPGITLSLAAGSEVASVESGRIVHGGYLRGYGNLVIVDHGDGWYSLYGFLGRILHNRGEVITRGQVIGLAGESGSEVGPALFFGIRHRDKSYDPVEWLE
jgi:septal ring factor EnvC (AmiA/AmiB activator)